MKNVLVLAKKVPLFILGIGMVLMNACSNPSSTGVTINNGTPVVTGDGEQIIIVDRTGKEWDITHAVKKYQMKPENFQFGLGPEAIPPILNPEFTSPGDPGHPDNDQTFLVIGTEINGESRAYPIFVMKSHEIVDDKFGDAYVAVAY